MLHSTLPSPLGLSLRPTCRSWLGLLWPVLMLLCASSLHALEDVVWMNPVSTTATYPTPGQGSTLTKTGATAGWNADAESVNRLRGAGWVEWKFDRLDKRMSMGLALVNSDRSYTPSFNYEIIANVTSAFAYLSGGLVIREGAVNVLVLPGASFTVGDVFKIKRSGVTVQYLKNDVVLYTSLTKSVGTLSVDNSFYDAAGATKASISGCRLEDSGEEDVIWDEITGATADYATTAIPDQGSKITGSTEGAVSSKLISGDGNVKFKFGVTAKQMAVGFMAFHIDNNRASLTHGIEATGTTNNFRIIESGATMATGTFAVTDLFSIQRSGTSVSYYQNDVLIQSSAVASNGPVLVSAGFLSSSGFLTNCRYSGVSKFERVFWIPSNTGIQATYYGIGARSRLACSVTNGWDRGGTSVKRIVRGGTVRFQFGQVTNNLVAGLVDYTGTLFTQGAIKLGLLASSTGMVQVIESGVLKGTALPYTASDVFSIQRSGDAIAYSKNGVVFYQHAVVGTLATESLRFDTTFGEAGGSIFNCEYSGVAADVVWRDVVKTAPTYASVTTSNTNVGLEGSRLYKTATTTAADAGGISQNALSGDGYLEVHANQTDKKITIGLTANDADLAGSFPYGIILNTAGAFQVIENTTVKASGTYTTADEFRIVRKNNSIIFYKNGVSIYVSTTPVTAPRLFADTSFYTAGTASAISQARIYAAPADSDEDGLLDAWEYQYFNSLDSGLQSGGVGFEADFDHDGQSNLYEFEHGTDPKDYYDGIPPDLRITSGNNQLTVPDIFVPEPLVISVYENTSVGSPLLADAPVTFSISSGGGKLAATFGGAVVTTLDVRSDPTTGQAKVYFKQPNLNSVSTVVHVTAGTGSAVAVPRDFTISTNELLLYWKLNEAAGSTTALNSGPTGTTYNGTLVNSPARLASLGIGGTYDLADFALDLNGTTQFVENAGTLNPTVAGNISFTAMLWVRADPTISLASTANVYPLLSKYAATSFGFDFSLRGGDRNGLSFRFMENGVLKAGQELIPTTNQAARLLDGKPHLVAFTRDSANQGRLYIDGVEVGALAGMNASRTTASTTKLFLGKNSAAAPNFFKGQIDDVRICAAALRSDEIAGHYANYDSDQDGLADAWERKYFNNSLTNGAAGDFDNDGLSNLAEFTLGADPSNPDTDGDQLLDGLEVQLGTGLFTKDTDGDGTWDGIEYANNRNPNAAPVPDPIPSIVQLRVLSRQD